MAGYVAHSGSTTVGLGYEAPGGGVKTWGAKLTQAPREACLSG
jgi:hypothetical protein